MQMCDALSRNMPKGAAGVEILLANCLAHGRRQFVEIAPNFPDECRYVLESLGRSITTMRWRENSRFPPRSDAPSSGAQRPADGAAAWVAGSAVGGEEDGAELGPGQSDTYLLRHWKALTAFLRQAGAPLDNNI